MPTEPNQSCLVKQLCCHITFSLQQENMVYEALTYNVPITEESSTEMFQCVIEEGIEHFGLFSLGDFSLDTAFFSP